MRLLVGPTELEIGAAVFACNLFDAFGDLGHGCIRAIC
jgi:hypothetical protein